MPPGTPAGGPTHRIDNNSKNAWQVMRDKDREKVLNAIKGQFPDRYAKMIEQYYKDLQESE